MCFFFYNIIDYIGQDKKQMKNILQRDNEKRDKKIKHKHISHCSFK